MDLFSFKQFRGAICWERNAESFLISLLYYFRKTNLICIKLPAYWNIPRYCFFEFRKNKSFTLINLEVSLSKLFNYINRYCFSIKNVSILVHFKSLEAILVCFGQTIIYIFFLMSFISSYNFCTYFCFTQKAFYKNIIILYHFFLLYT